MTEPAPGRVHVVGAGLAGLATAVHLVGRGVPVTIHEAAGHAGGRCRSFYDNRLDCLIDNGNHLIMAGNKATFAYLDAIGARRHLVAKAPAAFPFVDLASGERWCVRPNRGRLPWWPLVPARRVGGTRALDYLQAIRLPFAGRQATVAEVLGEPAHLFERLWNPLATAALNTAPEEGAARLLWPVVAQTFLRGEAACRPYVADQGLSPAFVDPALKRLADNGATVTFNRRVRALDRADGRVHGLICSGGPISLDPADQVILAVPPAGAKALIADLVVPEESRAIVNAHYGLDHPPRLPGGSRFLGLIGGTAHWLFARDSVVSVTVSAADQLADRDNTAIAEILWADVARALDLPARPRPPSTVINERRATFAQTPANLAARPGAATAWANLFLAGDWTDTGLPATIESAIHSGRAAADLANSRRRA
ncbi:MAG: hydroxysqualene dehydroxylase HpnE [Alphaproteobacteria bacterium]|jgi:squalene-associated FAD-dependent desaturase|nr:hydroxysqualene dehydroxylase HpnE [Alphaproteobacteria bacterium]MDP6517123.1 hydroxysqualene dehydroxylase HpnE [Alphaproteobacteria bacterium]